ncbi:hypothetical protein AMTRI_Chr07g24300 [Amborella trichopoda]|uniref:ENTH domain-containing protein n=1 Tax=Amborella trichopoda TaxID=13333 RepID=U5D991_AMBTC|nr:ENTH domain-containing protein C794.11c [Amborella trichopoda]ERN18800.1 hypothetical protein AMTR_s00067p00089010 [Amborella trichopoda]|eukprot:XP_006857333.1 ENTH domain-containing protein C794.11c [Amborella trichopoda]
MFLSEVKKQASFFLKEKLKSARLVLTDVTHAELLTEEATNGDPWGPDARTMRIISQAAFEVDEYWRISDILHRRFYTIDKKNWRQSYKSLVLLEYLLTHGPDSFAEDFERDKHVIEELANFQYVDERGLDWGRNMRKKSESIQKLLDDNEFLTEARINAHKLSREIQGFGSFNSRSSSSSQSTPPAKTTLRSSSFGYYPSSCSSYSNNKNKAPAKEGDLDTLPEEMERREKPILLEFDRKIKGGGHEVERSLEKEHPFCQNDEEDSNALLSGDCKKGGDPDMNNFPHTKRLLSKNFDSQLSMKSRGLEV